MANLYSSEFFEYGTGIADPTDGYTLGTELTKILWDHPLFSVVNSGLVNQNEDIADDLPNATESTSAVLANQSFNQNLNNEQQNYNLNNNNLNNIPFIQNNYEIEQYRQYQQQQQQQYQYQQYQQQQQLQLQYQQQYQQNPQLINRSAPISDNNILNQNYNQPQIVNQTQIIQQQLPRTTMDPQKMNKVKRTYKKKVKDTENQPEKESEKKVEDSTQRIRFSIHDIKQDEYGLCILPIQRKTLQIIRLTDQIMIQRDAVICNGFVSTKKPEFEVLREMSIPSETILCAISIFYNQYPIYLVSGYGISAFAASSSKAATLFNQKLNLLSPNKKILSQTQISGTEFFGIKDDSIQKIIKSYSVSQKIDSAKKIIQVLDINEQPIPFKYDWIDRGPNEAIINFDPFAFITEELAILLQKEGKKINSTKPKKKKVKEFHEPSRSKLVVPDELKPKIVENTLYNYTNYDNQLIPIQNNYLVPQINDNNIYYINQNNNNIYNQNVPYNQSNQTVYSMETPSTFQVIEENQQQFQTNQSEMNQDSLLQLRKRLDFETEKIVEQKESRNILSSYVSDLQIHKENKKNEKKCNECKICQDPEIEKILESS